ncbi:hypothetical protein [Streptomyces sp. NPDC049555]|uniref:hypothetical protein n=1 Tax=Streptomyces sp. NPDC049555 TaxID=3154930 RepID=UPI0034335BEA
MPVDDHHLDGLDQVADIAELPREQAVAAALRMAADADVGRRSFRPTVAGPNTVVASDRNC